MGREKGCSWDPPFLFLLKLRLCRYGLGCGREHTSRNLAERPQGSGFCLLVPSVQIRSDLCRGLHHNLGKSQNGRLLLSDGGSLSARLFAVLVDASALPPLQPTAASRSSAVLPLPSALRIDPQVWGYTLSEQAGIAEGS